MAGRDPKGSYSFGGEVYGEGMGEGRAVADLDKLSPMKGKAVTADGEVVNAMNETPLDTGSVTKQGGIVSHPASVAKHDGTIPVLGGGSSSGNTEEDLEAMSKSELVELASEKGIEVSREDGESGAPTKADYVAALAGK